MINCAQFNSEMRKLFSLFFCNNVRLIIFRKGAFLIKTEISRGDIFYKQANSSVGERKTQAKIFY